MRLCSKKNLSIRYISNGVCHNILVALFQPFNGHTVCCRYMPHDMMFNDRVPLRTEVGSSASVCGFMNYT